MKNIISSEDLKSRDGRRKTSRVRAVTVNAERRRAFPPSVGSLGAPADPSACGRRDQAGAAAILNVCCVSPSAAARIKGPRLVPPRPVSKFFTDTRRGRCVRTRRDAEADHRRSAWRDVDHPVGGCGARDAARSWGCPRLAGLACGASWASL